MIVSFFTNITWKFIPVSGIDKPRCPAPHRGGFGWSRGLLDVQNANICCGFFRAVFCASDRRQYSVSMLWDLALTALIIAVVVRLSSRGRREEKGLPTGYVLCFVTPCRWARSSGRFKYHSTSEASRTTRPTTRRHMSEDEVPATSLWDCQVSPRLFYHFRKQIHRVTHGK